VRKPEPPAVADDMCIGVLTHWASEQNIRPSFFPCFGKG
jgi:hypothetical protein